MAARRTLAAWLLLVGAGCAARQQQAEGAASASPGDVVLGAVLPMSGEQAAFGLSTDRGVRLAVEEQNAKGGTQGRRVVYRVADSRSEPGGAATAMLRLAREERPLAVIGEVASSRALAMAPIADRMKVPLLTPAASNPRVTLLEGEVRPYVFRACTADPYQGLVMAHHAASQGLRRIAILKEASNEYSLGLASRFRERFARLGGVVVVELEYQDGEKDFGRQVAMLHGKALDAIYMPGYYNAVVPFALRAREAGVGARLLGGDGWDSRKIFAAAEALDGSWMSNHYTDGDTAPEVQRFISRYRAVYGEVPNALGVLGYDAAKIAFDAMERASALTGPAVRDALERTTRFPAVSGATTFDRYHDAQKPMVIERMAGATFRFVTRVEPPAE